MPPHPIFTDDFIKKMCPQNHPPPLQKVYNIAPSGTPGYMKTLPGIKPATPVAHNGRYGEATCVRSPPIRKGADCRTELRFSNLRETNQENRIRLVPFFQSAWCERG